MRTISALAILAAVALCAPAAAQEPCGEHVVQPGDTLARIAQETYGRADAQLIFQANRDRLSDPGLILPGQTLRLPCAEGFGGSGDEAAPVPAPGAGSEAPAAPAPDPAAPAPVVEAPSLSLRVATGGAHPGLPAADRAEARGRQALSLGAPDREVQTAPGGADALADLHPDGEAVLALPWIVPDCAGLHLLPAPLAALCTRYDRSPPLAAIPVLWFARRGSDASRAEAPAALRGLRVCRPAGAPDADLLAAGLAPPRTWRLSPETAADCLRLVAQGEADVASLPTPADPPPVPPELARNRALSATLTFHALARKDSAEGRAALAALNRGIASLEEE